MGKLASNRGIKGVRVVSGTVGGKVREKDIQTDKIYGMHSSWYVIKQEDTERIK